jgi:hypothetical protein
MSVYFSMSYTYARQIHSSRLASETDMTLAEIAQDGEFFCGRKGSLTGFLSFNLFKRKIDYSVLAARLASTRFRIAS